jgi:hypothetical protein
MMDTIKHEICHAIESLFGMDHEIIKPTEEDDENKQKFHSDEHHCSVLASGWVMIERDNAEFRNWFNELYDIPDGDPEEEEEDEN